MPYNNMPESMWGKMDSCVKDVMGQGKDKQHAIAICYTSMMGKKTDTFHKSMKTMMQKGGMK